MCNEKTCEVCHGNGTVKKDLGWNPFPWIKDGKLTEVKPCPRCVTDPAEGRKIKRDFERVPDKFVSREG